MVTAANSRSEQTIAAPISYECAICGWSYDPDEGAPDLGIPPGTAFVDLPDGFCCPLCGADKSSFAPRKKAAADTAAADIRTVRTAVTEVVERTPSVKSFRLAVSGTELFQAGQYLQLSLPGKEPLSRCLSISSSPTEEGYLEVTKRITESGFSRRLSQAAPGTEADIAFPLGSFTFSGEHKRIALLSGGIGITPLRSICRYIVDTQLAVDVCLLYASRTEEEIAFRADFQEMQAACPRLKVVHTLSRAESTWSGRRGRIDARMVQEEVPDYSERCFFLCGPPQMVDSLSALLLDELRLPEEQVKTENFTGY